MQNDHTGAAGSHAVIFAFLPSQQRAMGVHEKFSNYVQGVRVGCRRPSDLGVCDENYRKLPRKNI